MAVLVLWVLFIWGHSLVPADNSDAESLAAVDALWGVFAFFGCTDIAQANHVVRKVAHFCEYFVLGVLLVVSGGFRPRSSAMGAQLAHLGLAALVPCVDETIQLHVPGRSGQVSDVLLDCSGLVCGVAVACGVSALVARRAAKSQADSAAEQDH